MPFVRPSSSRKHAARARSVLRELVGDVLSAPRNVLEAQLARSPWLVSRLGTSSDHVDRRLREVLDRDRALVAAQPDLARQPAPVLAPAPTLEDAAASPQQEPIRTRTMARLLAAQGYRARALAIYQALIAENPADTELHAEAERVHAQSA
jgi:hypothetical protein